MTAGAVKLDQAAKYAQKRVEKALEQGKEPDPRDLKMLEQAAQEEQQAVPQVLKVSPQAPPLHQAQSTQYHLPNQQRSTERGSTGSDTEPKPPPKRKVTVKELEYYDFFDNRFGPLVVLLLWFFTAKLETAVFYAPTPAECHELAPHLARVAPRVEDLVHMPKWAHEAIIVSDDITSIGMVLMGYLERIGVLEKMAPWFTGAGEKARQGYERAFNSDSGIRDVQERPHPAGAHNGAYNGKPINLDTVRGLGEQYRPA